MKNKYIFIGFPLLLIAVFLIQNFNGKTDCQNNDNKSSEKCDIPQKDNAVSKWNLHENIYETTVGIDVSHFQSAIDWSRVKGEGVDFVVVKSTQGMTFTDPYFIKNVEGASKEKIRVGAYHFLSSLSPPIAQAEHFLEKYETASSSINLPPVLDLEWDINSKNGQDRWAGFLCEEVIDLAATWLSVVERKLGKPIIYTSNGWLADYRDCGVEKLFKYPFWVAKYGTPPDDLFKESPKDVVAWQFSEAAKVAGIKGRVDMSIWFVKTQ